MERRRAAELLSSIAGKRALCVGDVIFDEFVYGETRRISREAPVPILSETRRMAMLGGAGNLARNIASLGGAPIVVSVVGDDAAGEAVTAMIMEANAGADGLVRTPGRATPAKIRYVANNQQMLCVDRDPESPIGSDAETALIAAATARMGEADVLVLSDYGRGLMTPEVSGALIEAARKAGVPVVVDPRGRDYARYDGADVIKQKTAYVAEEARMAVHDDASADEAMRAVLARLAKTRALLVTRGGAGMSLLEGDGPVQHHRARPRSVFDVSGAGDTALAALSLSLAGGVDLVEAMALADLAAGAAVAKAGTATVSPDEVLADADAGGESPAWRVLSRAAAAELAAGWRARGLKVGFTNGCFDILHAGHLSALRHARSVCDRLVVGLNDDASVSRLKGPERPLNTAEDRAVMLASLETVDRVVIFSEDTPADLIEAVRPDVLVKGADYAAADLPGAAFVKANGGEVVLAPLEEGRSTTSLLERIKGGA